MSSNFINILLQHSFSSGRYFTSGKRIPHWVKINQLKYPTTLPCCQILNYWTCIVFLYTLRHYILDDLYQNWAFRIHFLSSFIHEWPFSSRTPLVDFKIMKANDQCIEDRQLFLENISVHLIQKDRSIDSEVNYNCESYIMSHSMKLQFHILQMLYIILQLSDVMLLQVQIDR